MLEDISGLHKHASIPTNQLLIDDEIILIVDDDAGISEPLKTYFEMEGLAVAVTESAAGCLHMLDTRHVALVLLDIGLPDTDGLTLLPQLVEKYQDLAVVMLTGVDDLQTAIDCIRNGADDYISKPVQFQEILFVIRKVLEKRRLIFENRKYNEELEKAHFRIRLLHQLSLKMNTVYLSTVELEEILRAILVGITAEEGLRFNRAFLAIFDDQERVLRGRLAIGPDCRERAGHIWAEMKGKQLDFLDIVKNINGSCSESDVAVNKLIRELEVPVDHKEHILIRAANERKSIVVTGGRAEVEVPHDLLQLLSEDTFVVVPLFSPSRSLGVIIADYFVTHQQITDEIVSSLELFASQASLAIEHSHYYMDMQAKITALEAVTHELDKNKDLLVEAEKFSALGHMSAQLVHVIRNPVTSIGGAARVLAKRATGEEWLKFIEMIIKETSKLESTLGDLFDFVQQSETNREKASLFSLIKKTNMLVQTSAAKQSVTLTLDLPEPDPQIYMDIRQIRQMLLQLVRNGIEAMPDGGRLTVKVRIEDGKAVILISDTGVGMVEGGMERSKDPFFTTKTYGTGLGLTLVEQIVQEHEGAFNLKMREEGGMEARVELPIAED